MDNTPIFVKISEYHEIMKVVEEVNKKMEDIRASLGELREIKSKEETQMQEWANHLDKVSEKLNYINATLKEM